MTALALLVALQASAPVPRAPAPPPPVEALVDENAARRGIDPLLVRTLIMHESSGNPRAVGPSGKDFGLMQLRIGAATRGLKLSRKLLFDPATNIYFGVWYLADQLASCGTVSEALGSYSSGRGCRVNGYARRLLRKYRRAQAADRGVWAPGRSARLAPREVSPRYNPGGFVRRRPFSRATA